MQQQNSMSGTRGVITMYVANTSEENREEFKVYYDNPYTGGNTCNLSGEINGLKFTQLYFSGSYGRVAICIMKIENT